jgi:hypothetical protein
MIYSKYYKDGKKIDPNKKEEVQVEVETEKVETEKKEEVKKETKKGKK